MKYAMLIYLGDDPRCVDGAHLQLGEMATTVRHGGRGNLITDGPFADPKEVLVGYYVLEAPDLDAALEFAERIPAVPLGGAGEVRPIVEMPAEAAH